MRRNETVRVLRAGPPWLQLPVVSPHGDRRALQFANEQELLDFQQDYEDQFIREGWRLIEPGDDHETFDRTASSAVLPVISNAPRPVDMVS